MVVRYLAGWYGGFFGGGAGGIITPILRTRPNYFVWEDSSLSLLLATSDDEVNGKSEEKLCEFISI